MGCCCSQGLTKTEMAIVEARAMQKYDYLVSELNFLLDDPFPFAVWEEFADILRLPRNRQQLELLQVRPDEYWDSSIKNRASLGDARIEILAAALCNYSHHEPAWVELRKGFASLSLEEGLPVQVAESPLCLKSLYLDFNDIGPEGTKSLATMLMIMVQRGGSLEVLSLNNNNIGDEGAGFLAHALTQNVPLQRLLLRDNNIGPPGSKALAAAMATNTCLIEIEMGGNQGEEAINCLQEAVERNKRGN